MSTLNTSTLCDCSNTQKPFQRIPQYISLVCACLNKGKHFLFTTASCGTLRVSLTLCKTTHAYTLLHSSITASCSSYFFLVVSKKTSPSQALIMSGLAPKGAVHPTISRSSTLRTGIFNLRLEIMLANPAQSSSLSLGTSLVNMLARFFLV